MRLSLGLSVFLILFFLPAPAWGEPVEDRYREAATGYHGLAKQEQARPAQWRAVAEEFYSLFGEHVGHPRGPDGLYSSALALLAARRAGGGARDLALALGRFQQFLRTYPDHRLADDSLMQIGGIFSIHPDDAQRAYLTYRQVLATYPKGDQVQLAGKYAAALEARQNAGGGGRLLSRPQSRFLARGQAKSSAKSKRRAAVARTEPKRAGARARTEPAPGIIKRVLYSTLENFTRVILTTDIKVDYKFRELPAKDGRPPRFYIDLKNARPRRGLAAEYPVGDAILKKIRISRNRGATRIVFDLNGQGRYEVKNLILPHEKKIIVDLYPKHPRTPAAAAPTVSPPAFAAQKAPRPAAVSSASAVSSSSSAVSSSASAVAAPASLRDALGLKVRNLVIDPGHGGRDPGATAFGLKEKHVALKLARALKAVFKERRPDIQVSLTRERDTYLSLGQRPMIAKSRGADLFVSIHLNAHKQERFSGVETYFLNLTSDASALQVAARENLSTEKQIGDLNGILRDLMQDTNIVESSKLARLLQSSLVTNLRGAYKVRNLGVKQAPFMVLIGAEMPSVLVEAGFLTNRRENRRLRDEAYLRKIAEGIYEGLRKYIEEQTFALDAPQPAGPGRGGKT